MRRRVKDLNIDSICYVRFSSLLWFLLFFFSISRENTKTRIETQAISYWTTTIGVFPALLTISFFLAVKFFFSPIKGISMLLRWLPIPSSHFRWYLFGGKNVRLTLFSSLFFLHCLHTYICMQLKMPGNWADLFWFWKGLNICSIFSLEPTKSCARLMMKCAR